MCSICPPLVTRHMSIFGKFQDTERFLIPSPRHVSSRLPSSGETCKYATAPITQKTWRDSLPIDMLLSAVSVLVVAQQISEVPEGLKNYPVYSMNWLVLVGWQAKSFWRICTWNTVIITTKPRPMFWTLIEIYINTYVKKCNYQSL